MVETLRSLFDTRSPVASSRMRFATSSVGGGTSELGAMSGDQCRVEQGHLTMALTHARDGWIFRSVLPDQIRLGQVVLTALTIRWKRGMLQESSESVDLCWSKAVPSRVCLVQDEFALYQRSAAMNIPQESQPLSTLFKSDQVSQLQGESSSGDGCP